jgi:hypothetical protein
LETEALFPALAWRPSKGARVRVRETGLLGEIVGMAAFGARTWYIVMLFTPDTGTLAEVVAFERARRQARVTYTRDELAPA